MPERSGRSLMCLCVCRPDTVHLWVLSIQALYLLSFLLCFNSAFEWSYLDFFPLTWSLSPVMSARAPGVKRWPMPLSHFKVRSDFPAALSASVLPIIYSSHCCLFRHHRFSFSSSPSSFLILQKVPNRTSKCWNPLFLQTLGYWAWQFGLLLSRVLLWTPPPYLTQFLSPLFW